MQKVGFDASSMEIIANVLNRLRKQQKKFLLFSPDEAESNRLSKVIQGFGIRGNPNWKSSVPIRRDGGLLRF